MDKSTLSNYGWIVIVTLVLSVMLAFATPFGSYVAKGASNVIKYFVNISSNSIDNENLEFQGIEWDLYLNDDPYHHKERIPDGGKYTTPDGDELTRGDKFPQPQDGDVYEYGHYRYTYVKEIKGWHAVALYKDEIECYNIILEQINFVPIISLEGTYSNCLELKGFQEGWRMPRYATNLTYTFAYCSKLTSFPDNFKIPQNTILMKGTFYSCTAIVHFPSDMVIPNTVTDTSYTFTNCATIKELPHGITVPDSVINGYGMFLNCYNLKTLPKNFKLGNSLVNSEVMFNSCYKLEELPNNFTLPDSLVVCAGMFARCKELTTIPDTFKLPSKVWSVYFMFAHCTKLEHIPDNFHISSNVVITSQFLYDCPNFSGSLIVDAKAYPHELEDGTIDYPYKEMFYGTTKPITISGNSPQMTEIIATANNNNVTRV